MRTKRQAALVNSLKVLMTAHKLASPGYSLVSNIYGNQNDASKLLETPAFFKMWADLLLLADGVADVTKYASEYRQHRALLKPAQHHVQLDVSTSTEAKSDEPDSYQLFGTADQPSLKPDSNARKQLRITAFGMTLFVDVGFFTQLILAGREPSAGDILQHVNILTMIPAYIAAKDMPINRDDKLLVRTVKNQSPFAALISAYIVFLALYPNSDVEDKGLLEPILYSMAAVLLAPGVAQGAAEGITWMQKKIYGPAHSPAPHPITLGGSEEAESKKTGWRETLSGVGDSIRHFLTCKSPCKKTGPVPSTDEVHLDDDLLAQPLTL